MNKLISTLALFLIIFSNLSWSKERTVILDVPGMYCAVCPITVKKSLLKLPGIHKVQASLKTKEAMVTFDDEKVSINQLEEATANAGYPSMLKTEVK